MGLRLPRYLGDAAETPPGSYHAEPAPIVAGVHARVCCPICGELQELGAVHAIERSGRVTPAFQCPTIGCSFWEWLELEAWGDEP